MSRETIKKKRKGRSRRRMQTRRDKNRLRVEQQRADRNRRDDADMDIGSPMAAPVPESWVKKRSKR